MHQIYRTQTIVSNYYQYSMQKNSRAKSNNRSRPSLREENQNLLQKIKDYKSVISTLSKSVEKLNKKHSFGQTVKQKKGQFMKQIKTQNKCISDKEHFSNIDKRLQNIQALLEQKVYLKCKRASRIEMSPSIIQPPQNNLGPKVEKSTQMIHGESNNCTIARRIQICQQKQQSNGEIMNSLIDIFTESMDKQEKMLRKIYELLRGR